MTFSYKCLLHGVLELAGEFDLTLLHHAPENGFPVGEIDVERAARNTCSVGYLSHGDLVVGGGLKNLLGGFENLIASKVLAKFPQGFFSTCFLAQ